MCSICGHLEVNETSQVTFKGRLGQGVLCTLPTLSLGRVLSHHKQEASCSYVNNAGP